MATYLDAILRQMTHGRLTMKTINFATATFSATFAKPADIVQVGVNGKDEPVVVYSSMFKGKGYTSIRTIYQDDAGDWNPGKGVTFPSDNADEIFCNIGAINNVPSKVVQINSKPATKSGKRKAA